MAQLDKVKPFKVRVKFLCSQTYTEENWSYGDSIKGFEKENESLEGQQLLNFVERQF